jgi:hypothetical protein
LRSKKKKKKPLSDSTRLFPSPPRSPPIPPAPPPECFEFASILWQDALNLVSFSRGEVNNQDGSTVQVTKVPFEIISAHLSVALESGIVNDSPKSLLPARSVSPEIIRILASQCPLIPQSEQTCKALTMDDAKPSNHDFVNDVLAWLANTLQAPRAAFRLAMTALSPKSSVPARSVSPEITRILAKQCPLISQIEPTSKVSTRDVLTKQCPLISQIEPTCKADTMDVLTSKPTIHSKTTFDDSAKLSTEAFVWIVGLVLIAGILRLFPTICSLVNDCHRIHRFLSLALDFAARAVKHNPHQRVEMEVRDLCTCALRAEFFRATKQVMIGEITKEAKDFMIDIVYIAK